MVGPLRLVKAPGVGSVIDPNGQKPFPRQCPIDDDGMDQTQDLNLPSFAAISSVGVRLNLEG
jgi:hypothetical protein